jgi:hypothetical protein
MFQSYYRRHPAACSIQLALSFAWQCLPFSRWREKVAEGRMRVDL